MSKIFLQPSRVPLSAKLFKFFFFEQRAQLKKLPSSKCRKTRLHFGLEFTRKMYFLLWASFSLSFDSTWK